MALIDLKAGPLVRLTGPAGHWTPMEQMVTEMGDASYALVERFDDLHIQDFAVFRPEMS